MLYYAARAWSLKREQKRLSEITPERAAEMATEIAAYAAERPSPVARAAARLWADITAILYHEYPPHGLAMAAEMAEKIRTIWTTAWRAEVVQIAEARRVLYQESRQIPAGERLDWLESQEAKTEAEAIAAVQLRGQLWLEDARA